MPASSSAKNPKTMSRFGRVPVRRMWRNTESIMASMSFMSTAPRPQIMPSLTSAANGSTDQSWAMAGTTSRWPCTSSASAPGSEPSRRVKTFARPGADSKYWASRPTSSISPATYSAAARSPSASPLA